MLNKRWTDTQLLNHPHHLYARFSFVCERCGHKTTVVWYRRGKYDGDSFRGFCPTKCGAIGTFTQLMWVEK